MPVAAPKPTPSATPATPTAPAAPPVKRDVFEEAKKVLTQEEQLKLNLGTRGVRNLPAPRFPDADLAVRAKGIRKPPYKTDIVLVNPPTPTARSGSAASTGWAAAAART